MHRKSIEAAEKLKSDEEFDTDASKDATNDNTTPCDMKSGTPISFSKSLAQCSESPKGTASDSSSKCNSPPLTSTTSSSPHFPREPSFRNDLRSNSIAVLRAKAIEHNAKVLSQSASPNHQRSSISQQQQHQQHGQHQQQSPPLVPTSISMYTSLDPRSHPVPYPFHASAGRPVYWCLSVYLRLNVRPVCCLISYLLHTHEAVW